MKNKSKLFFILFFSFCYNAKAQIQIEMKDIIKTRVDYIVDSIPNKYRNWYEPFTYSYDKMLFDTLKTVLSDISFSGKTFYWLERWDSESNSRKIYLWTDSIMVHFWSKDDVQKRMSFGHINKLGKNDGLSNSQFYMDFEEWNEFVTDRSYLHTNLYMGNIFNFCSMIRFKSTPFEKDSEKVEIVHCAFVEYDKDEPFYYLREQPGDGFGRRIKINCHWFEKRRYRIDWKYFEEYSNRGTKVFNCNGRLITSFPISPL